MFIRRIDPNSVDLTQMRTSQVTYYTISQSLIGDFLIAITHKDVKSHQIHTILAVKR